MLASLLSPTPTANNNSSSNAPPRISQLLPTVKCSTCNQPVPLDELGEHTCSEPPPIPSPPILAPRKSSAPDLPKPVFTPEAATALLPSRLQSRVANASGNEAGGASARSPSHQSRPSNASSTSISSANDRLRMNPKQKGGSPTFQARSSPLARKDSQQEESSSMRSRSRSSSRERLGAASPLQLRPSASRAFNDGIGMTGNRHNNNSSTSSNLRIRTPSNAGSSSNQSSPSTARPLGSLSRDRDVSPAQMTARPAIPPGPPPSGPLPPVGGPPSMRNGSMMPNRTDRTPPPPNHSGRTPPPGSIPNVPLPGPPNSIAFPPRMGPSPGPGQIINSRNTPTPPGSLGPPPPGPYPQPNQAQLLRRPTHKTNESFVPPAERGIDTKTGGEAGMAGVGRRGFAAAARAAMFVNHHQTGYGPPPAMGMGGTPGMIIGGGPPIPGSYNNAAVMRRSNAPQFLDIDAASRSTSTPPLSAGSGYSSHSPDGPTSPLNQSDFASSQLAPAPGVPPVKPGLPIPPTNNLLNGPGSAVSPASATAGRLPFFEKLKSSINSSGGVERSQSSASTNSMYSQRDREQDRLDAATPMPAHYQKETRPPSPVDSESEYGGLAYADSSDYEDDGDSNKNGTKDRDDRDDFGYGDNDSEDEGLARAERRRRRGLSRKDTTTTTSSYSSGVVRMGGGEKDRQRGSGVVLGARSISATRSRSRTGIKGSALPGLPLDEPITRSATSSTSSTRDAAYASNAARDESTFKKGHAQFGSVSARARSVDTDRGDGNGNGRSSSHSRSHAPSLSQSSSVMSASALRMGLSHSRDNSMSSTYSTDNVNASERVRSRADSAAAIAAALGLSRKPSQNSINGEADYSRLGGPGNLMRADSKSRKERDIRDKDGKREESMERTRYKGEEIRGRGMGLKIAATTGRRDPYTNQGLGENDSLARSNTVQSPETSRPIKLPTRSLTSPTLDRDKALYPAGISGSGVASIREKRRPTPKTCMRCKKTIEDGRWVSVADMPSSKASSVMCEKCWKGMYLPKCRRCNLPIEKQAVSSSDGQLKGKYHKDCFNCHICHKPFPDKSFYVYDGKPLCAYHYHEANDSLCAAARCGQPIEGPCAVSYTGDRYHPEHMTCEYYAGDPTRDCGERLEEYWEMDGRMLCERHARYGNGTNGGSGRGSGSEDEEGRRDRRAKKRVTRFIDLTGAGGFGDSGLR